MKQKKKILLERYCHIFNHKKNTYVLGVGLFIADEKRNLETLELSLQKTMKQKNIEKYKKRQKKKLNKYIKKLKIKFNIISIEFI